MAPNPLLSSVSYRAQLGERMDYLDFELELGVGSGREYPVAVVHSAAGEAHETMHFPFDELALENRLLALQNALLRSGGMHRQILSSEEQTVQNFGRALFDALFTGEVRSRYAVSRREAFNQGKGLRLKLRIQPAELAVLPWEFLYDPGQAEYICLSRNTPVVRYLELPQPPQPLTVTPPLRILGMIASPTDLADLNVEREKQRVEKATNSLQANGLVELTWLQGQTWQDLQRAMRRGPWHIFHFIGHGRFNSNTDEGLIALVDEGGKARNLSATHLGRLLTDHSSLRLVVLNSCEGARGSEHDIFSSTAAILVRGGISAVLAMQYEITDRAAIEFSHSFYEALADGMSVDTAVSEARKAISLGVANTVEWGTPVLYMRSPDGALFDLRQPLTAQPEKLLTVTPSFSPSTVERTEQVVHQHSDRDFFISYNRADRDWAEWIAWQLEEIGYSIILQDWDFRPGSNFVLDMQNATQETKRTIVVLSPHYLNARFTQAEWAAAFQQDPESEQGVLVPVRVQECKPEGLLGPIVYIDLVGLDESAAREKLLEGVRFGRGKPTSPPAFPEKVRRSMTHQSTFPGAHRNTIIPLEDRPAPDSNSHSLQRGQMPRRFSRRTILIGLAGVVVVSGTAGIVWLVTLGGISMNNWTLNGNAGTHPPNDFLGTTDSQPLVLKVNGNEAMRVDASGKVGIGTTTPFTSLHVLGRIASGFGGTSAGAITFYPAPEQTAWFHIDNPGLNGQATGHLRISYGGSPGEHTIMCWIRTITSLFKVTSL